MKVKLLKKFRKEAKDRWKIACCVNGYAIIEHYKSIGNYTKKCGLDKDEAFELLAKYRREFILEKCCDYVIKHIKFMDV